MNTPIIDFVKSYAQKKALRLHMPGHKGESLLGFEEFDLTEIDGADSLYEASGIIAESERNASELFGCDTFYSAEGSSLCIRAMMYLVTLYAREQGRSPCVLAARNAHKTFLSAAAFLDLDIRWIYPNENDTYLSCSIEPENLEKCILSAPEKPIAVYITSPDYLGNIADVTAISEVCHKHGVLLLVDNAHGAYLKFLPRSLHPIDLGADICCDSAHKTLPCLTGGAYLHVTRNAPKVFSKRAKDALSLFGSTSPSYLILQSLDAVNKYVSDGYRDTLSSFVAKLDEFKHALKGLGYTLVGNEPLKLAMNTAEYGYDGREFAEILREKNIEIEFADREVAVMMIAPENRDYGLITLFDVLIGIQKRDSISVCPPSPLHPKAVMSIREAIFSESETVSVADCVGRVLASPTVSCPPAVPIVVSGERIDETAVKTFEYYDIEILSVLKR